MSETSKKHHYVPQAQLRHFARDSGRSSLFVFDKETSKSFLSSILNAGSENHFNTISYDGGRWNFEHLFQDVDSRSARLVAEIVSRRSLAWLKAEDSIALSELFATQLLRTHFSRTTPMRLAEDLREMIRRVGYDPDTDPAMAMPTDASLRLGAAEAFLGRHPHTGALLRLRPALYAATGAGRFVISDHPVTRTNAFPYGDLGLASPGILVLLPISPELTIALQCPTIVQRYESASGMNLPREQATRARRYRDGLRSGQPIEIDDDTVIWANSHQIVQSRRYLYGATDAFDFARDFLRQHPEARSVDSHIVMGEIGQRPPRRSGMPAGIQLLIFGPVDHCMLAIEEFDESGEGITVRTRQIDLLGQVAADAGMLHAELYIDGHCRRGMREAKIERFGECSDGWFRVVHRDPMLRALGARYNAKKSDG
jgi:hypothetical protein